MSKEIQQQSKKIGFWTIALMGFSCVWGFANILSGFYYFDGTHAIFWWILIFVLYFIPYAFMVGELGSAFKTSGGGVSSWISATIGPKLGFLAGWTYFVVHIPYLVSKAHNIIIALSWVGFQSNVASSLDIRIFSALSLGIFLLAYFVAKRGMKTLGRISSSAGSASLFMSLAFVALMVGWVIFSPEGNVAVNNYQADSFVPYFKFDYILDLAILVFSVGGIEKIAPYVNQTRKPRFFTQGIIMCVIMINLCALLGTLAVGLMFDSNNIPKDLLTNGAYYAFQLLGEYLGVGNILMVLYAAMYSFLTFTVAVISIDAPLRTLLTPENGQYISSWFYKKNKNGIYKNAYRVVLCVVGALLVIPALGIPNVDGLIEWLVKMNSVIMPMRYLWVFVAYIALKRGFEKFSPKYVFMRNKSIGILVAIWCFLITAASCITGVYSESAFEMSMNIILPVVLIGAGSYFIYNSERKKKA